MLIDFDHDKTLYILGDVAPAMEIKNWVRAESVTDPGKYYGNRKIV